MALYIGEPRPELKKQIHEKLMLNAFPEKIKNELSDVFAKYVKEVKGYLIIQGIERHTVDIAIQHYNIKKH